MSTKKLAKQLGFVRKRSQPSTGQKKPLTSNQIFPYLIVIDFESTCWRERNSYGQEIIEFPAVLLNTATGEVESEFHTYVQPQEHPILSDFCTQLTGIPQQQVEAGVPLHICLSRFSRWLQTLEHQRGVVFPRDQRAPVAEQRPCAFVTWSDWDLGVCLLYECKRKQLHKPAVLNSWIDLRATYRLFYNRKPKGLNGALLDLGIQFSGREHSGLDDARNTAHLAWRMMRDGCVMKITRSLERAPLKTKPLFGNGNVPGNGCPSNKGDNNTTIKKPSKTAESGDDLENQPNSKPVSNTDVVETRPKPSDSMVPNTEVNYNLTAEPVQYQSIVSPKTLLNGLTTPMCGGRSNSSRTVRIGTIRSVSSPMTFNIPSPHHYINSLVLVSTTMNCITHLPQPDPTLDPETGSMEEDLPILVETESCSSYDDVVLEEDWDVMVGDEASVADVYTENERFEVDDTSVYGKTLLCPSPVHSNPGRGPTNSRPSSNTTNTPCQRLTSLVHKTDTRTSSRNLVSLKAETTRTYNTSAPNSLSPSSFVKPRPVTPGSNLSHTRSRLNTETSNNSFVIDKNGSRISSSSAKAETTRIFNTSGSNSSCSFSFAKPRPVTHDSNRSATRSRPQTATSNNSFVIYKDKPRASNNSSTSSISITSNTSTASNHSFVKPRPGLQNSNLHATLSRSLTTKNPGNSFTSMSSTTNLPNPSFTRPKPVTTSGDSNLSVSQTPNGSASNLSFARPRPVIHNPNPSTSRSSLHAETPNSSFMIHKYSSCLSSVSRPSVGGSSSILSSSVNRSSFLPNRSTKITAPLCDCGRRAKRLTVCNGGPNQGRAFYCCAVRKHGPGGTRKGCELFKWESALLQAKSPASAAASIALCFGLNSSVVRPPVII
ncbi:ERI1 exoribonuclease 2-like [Salmo trutta]|uniref:ERI1 exoribonuclease 2-like n=1 Tax=Salmo trutta TaxID=8032 RepID=UPI0011309877|nr:ERI1 exoribonuclease 2-like [Salmo trutta]